MGHDVKCLVTVFPKSSDSQLLHFPAIELTKLQSKTLKIPQITLDLDSDGRLDYYEFLQATTNHHKLLNNHNISSLFSMHKMKLKDIGSIGHSCFLEPCNLTVRNTKSKLE